MLGPLRTLPSLALSAAATTLRLLASINETLAQRLNPEQPAPAPTAAAPTAPTAPSAASAPSPIPARDETTPAEAKAPDATTTVDIAALAAKPAPQVIAAIDTLSTGELGDLYIHEAGNRRRRTVLAALETASAPPAADDDLPPLDARAPDELVYSTVGAKRPNG